MRFRSIEPPNGSCSARDDRLQTPRPPAVRVRGGRVLVARAQSGGLEPRARRRNRERPRELLDQALRAARSAAGALPRWRPRRDRTRVAIDEERRSDLPRRGHGPVRRSGNLHDRRRSTSSPLQANTGLVDDVHQPRRLAAARRKGSLRRELRRSRGHRARGRDSSRPARARTRGATLQPS
jgi:hypothetical protein